MVERNRIFINKQQLENLIKLKHKIFANNLGNKIIVQPIFEYICETEPESGEIVKITEKFLIKGYENVREILLNDNDITSIMEDFLADTDYSFSAFACHFETANTKNNTKKFDGIYVYLTKKQLRKLEKIK